MATVIDALPTEYQEIPQPAPFMKNALTGLNIAFSSRFYCVGAPQEEAQAHVWVMRDATGLDKKYQEPTLCLGNNTLYILDDDYLSKLRQALEAYGFISNLSAVGSLGSQQPVIEIPQSLINPDLGRLNQEDTRKFYHSLVLDAAHGFRGIRASRPDIMNARKALGTMTGRLLADNEAISWDWVQNTNYDPRNNQNGVFGSFVSNTFPHSAAAANVAARLTAIGVKNISLETIPGMSAPRLVINQRPDIDFCLSRPAIINNSVPPLPPSGPRISFGRPQAFKNG